MSRVQPFKRPRAWPQPTCYECGRKIEKAQDMVYDINGPRHQMCFPKEKK